MARFWLEVTMITCSMPAATASSTAYWMTGLSTRGSISLGWALVAGRNRVPQPAAGKTALRIRIEPRNPVPGSAGIAPTGFGKAPPVRDGRARPVYPRGPAIPPQAGMKRWSDLAVETVVGGRHRQVARPAPLVAGRQQPDCRERDPHLAEDLDRDQEPGEEEHHRGQLAGLEER